MIFEGVDQALRLELQRSWEASDHGRMLYEVLPRVGREWQPVDIDWVPSRGVTLVARFLTGHCHLGGFSLPWDPLESVPCPLCGGEFSREHLLWECSAVSAQREEFLSQGLEIQGIDLGCLAHLSVGSLSRFLFGHSANLSDRLFGGSFWRLSIFMTWSRQVCVGNCWTVWPDYGRHLCGGCGFLFFLFWDDISSLAWGVRRVGRLMLWGNVARMNIEGTNNCQ